MQAFKGAILAFLFSVLSTQASAADALLAAKGPYMDPLIDKAPIPYRLLKWAVVDIDKVFIEKLGLKVAACDYEKLPSHELRTYAGLGPCLYLSFVRGFTTPDMPGAFTATVEHAASGKRVPVLISWRPGRASGWERIREFVAPFFNENLTRPSPEIEPIIGVLSIKFERPESADLLGLASPLILDRKLGGLNEILIMTWANLEKPKEKTDMQVVLFQEGQQYPSFSLFVSTNANPLHLTSWHLKDRSLDFDLEAQ